MRRMASEGEPLADEVGVGARNTTLFNDLLRLAKASETRDELLREPIDDHSLFDLTPAGQTIRLGAPEILTLAEIEKIAKFAASAWSGRPLFRLLLEEDLSAGRLIGREADLAKAILNSPRGGAERKAPSDFNPAVQPLSSGSMSRWGGLGRGHDFIA